MTVDHVLPHSLDDIYGPGAEDAYSIPETTYTVRVDDGRVVEMTGMQEDLDKILAAMKSVRSEPAERLTGIDYVLGTEEHRVVGSLDFLNMLRPETAGLAMDQAITKADSRQDQLDLLKLAAEYMTSRDESDRRAFLEPFKRCKLVYSRDTWSAFMGATGAQ